MEKWVSIHCCVLPVEWYRLLPRMGGALHIPLGQLKKKVPATRHPLPLKQNKNSQGRAAHQDVAA